MDKEVREQKSYKQTAGKIVEVRIHFINRVCEDTLELRDHIDLYVSRASGSWDSISHLRVYAALLHAALRYW